MDNRPDDTPRTDGPVGLPESKRVTPDPHAGEPAPPPEEGRRPEEAEADRVRPAQQEPMGPMAELFSADVTDVEARYLGDREAEAEAERMGVEGEGIASGQILGLMAATIVVVLIAIVAVFYLTSLQTSTASGVVEGEIAELPEGVDVRNEAIAVMEQYTRSGEDSLSFTIPIDRAIELTIADYATAQAGLTDLVDAPETRAEFNAEATIIGRAIAQGVSPSQASEIGAPEVPAAEAAPAGSALDVPAGAPEADAPAASDEDADQTQTPATETDEAVSDEQ